MNEVKMLSVEEEAQVNGGFPPLFYAAVAIGGCFARGAVRDAAFRIGIIGAVSDAANAAADKIYQSFFLKR